MRIRIKQLQYVIKVAELGSINEAAKHLYVTQPSLSKIIKELEEQVGIQIFQRLQTGVILTNEGSEFLIYARQILEQVALMRDKYKGKESPRRLFSVSSQHYAFVVHAFVELIYAYEKDHYEFTLRETETHNIIEDVRQFRSEIGILFLNHFNEKVLLKIIKEHNLVFTPIFEARAHVFVGKQNPLAQKRVVSLTDLEDYPYLSYEQGQHGSLYFAEEILSTQKHKKSIKVSDRATIFNLMIGLNGYTFSSGVISRELNDENIIAIPLDIEEKMTIGWLKHEQFNLSSLAKQYLTYLHEHICDYGFDLLTQ